MLLTCLLFSAFAGCGNTSDQSQTTAPAANHEAGIKALDGKKVIFIGNSHTYYSKCVIDKGQATGLAARSNDQGLFYQFCKENGINVNVTN